MEENFIEHKNFLRIYHNNNKVYRKEHQRHNRALNFQYAILVACIAMAVINNYFDIDFIHNLYLDQTNRIYALLVALLTAILIGITPIDREGKLTEPQYDYTDITYKQDYVTVIMYTLMLYMVAITANVLYAMFFQYFDSRLITFVFWIFHTFILLDSMFFSFYCVDELADIVKFIK